MAHLLLTQGLSSYRTVRPFPRNFPHPASFEVAGSTVGSAAVDHVSDIRAFDWISGNPSVAHRPTHDTWTFELFFFFFFFFFFVGKLGLWMGQDN
jgi:hypothetical protein